MYFDSHPQQRGSNLGTYTNHSLVCAESLLRAMGNILCIINVMHLLSQTAIITTFHSAQF
jgi:hypothetical protein